MMSIVEKIQAFHAHREHERLLMKYDLMRASRFAFFRGSCHLFYDQLPDYGIFKSAPLSWICGDLHLENFGSYKGNNRLVYFDLNDFDEAALAPVSWELIRMLTSIRVWASSMSTSDAQEQTLCECFLSAYATALASGKPYWLERETATGMIKHLLDDLRNRDRQQFLNTRTELPKGRGKHRKLLIDGRKALPITTEQRSRVQQFMTDFAQAHKHPKFYQVMDMARRVAGTGSLGIERFVILVEGKGSPNQNYLLDLKQSLPSSLAPFLKARKIMQPKWQNPATRVVTIQHHMQAMPMAFLQAVTMDEQSYVLRGLQPSEDRVSLDLSKHSLTDVQNVLANMGKLTAWAQLRSSGKGGAATADELMSYAARTKWRNKLLNISQELCDQVSKDAATFNKAYDDHALILEP